MQAPGGQQAVRPANAAMAQMQQMAQMQALMASNPALAAQFAAQHQAMMARMASQNGPAAAAAAGRPGLPPTSKGSLKSAAGPSATGSVRMDALPAKKSNPGRKRKSMDQRLPDHGDLLVPDSPLFTQLQDAERRVDMLISRKKHELQEMFSSFRRGPPGTAAASGSVRRKLRVYLRSEHLHQKNAADAAEPPSWVLTLSGRLVGSKDKDEGSHPDLKQPLTHFFRRVTFQLDPAQYPGPQGRVVWDKVQHDPEHKEAIQLRRLGAAPVEALVTVELDHQPAQYRLSAALAGVLGLKGLHSVAFVMQMLWGYIKANSLYEPSEKGIVTVRCDEKLRRLFGADSVQLGRMSELVKANLTPPEPVQLRYTIKPQGPASPPPDCYDFDIEVPMSTELPPFALKAGAGREVEQLDTSLNSLLTRLAEHRRRRTFLLAFAQSPADFVQAMVAAQGRELRTSASKDGDELLVAGDLFQDRWVDDCIINYISRREHAASAAEQQAQQAQQQAAALASAAAAQQQQQAAAATALAAQQAAGGGGPASMSLSQQAAMQAVMQQQRLQQQHFQQQQLIQQQQQQQQQQATAL
ncbi:hypothetical protein D9Q98_001047 [Chlorella vulgaris]|uniref:DM2 domain-containing protein n=1 Tax=Chlorella vulgaris TaxID=3077 RepID=A0A9D4Z274_CHLVU|nr:hypothetical protein D9Q98_001047 [Chlorella vulgaris]